MLKDYDALFQERIDELLLIEQRIQRRADKFLQLNKDYQEKCQTTYEQLFGKIGEINNSLQKINTTSENVSYYVDICKKHANRSTLILLWSLIASAFIILGSLCWSHHVNNDLADAKAELASLTTKLKHTPFVLHFQGKDFIRVVPDSETGFTRGDGNDAPGRYAEVWHVR